MRKWCELFFKPIVMRSDVISPLHLDTQIEAVLLNCWNKFSSH